MESRTIVTWSPNGIAMASQAVLLWDHVLSLRGDLMVLLWLLKQYYYGITYYRHAET